MTVIDSIPAYSIEIGDQIIVEDDPIEVTYVGPTDDVDEIIVRGYSYEEGGPVEYPLYADDKFDLWTV